MKTPDQEVLYFIVKLDSFKFFLERTDIHWNVDLKKYKKTIENDNYQDNTFKGRRDLYASLDVEFPQYQRRANFMILVAFFEDFLNQLSISVQNYKNLSTEFSTYQEGRGLDKNKKYLQKIALIDFPSKLQEWNKIKNAQKIRNIIAHADGHIHEENHKKQLKIVQETNGLDYNEYARTHLEVKADYVIETLGNMREFASALHGVVKEMN